MVKSSLVLFEICLLLIHISAIYGSNYLPSDGEKYKILDPYSACSRGWYSFGNMCYTLGGKTKVARLNWEDAQNFCEKENSTLATINSQEIQDFLTAIVLMSAQFNVWIGLHDRHNETDYKWADGTPYGNFHYYEPEEPSGFKHEDEDCIEMVMKSARKNGKPGQWNDVNCNNQYQFICQKPKVKTDHVTVPKVDPRYCESEQGIGWRFEDSCFHLITDIKSWSDAEESCIKEYNGHLATLDYRVNEYLKYVLREIKEQIWIGVKIKEQTQQQWSSGWMVTFENWRSLEEYVDGTCVLLDGNGSWLLQSCKKKLMFLCEYSTVSPPVLTPPAKAAVCPKQPPGWRDFGGERCYFLDIHARVSWYEAHFDCMRRDGTLASIHSEAEANVLFQFFRYNYGAHSYIGFHRHMSNEGEFVWADGTEVDFTDWDVGEPNKETERCTEVRAYNMKWNDQVCTERRGYICSIPKTPLNSTTESSATVSCEKNITTNSLIGVIACVLVFSLLIGLVLYHFKVCDRGYDRVKKLSTAKLPVPGEPDKKTRYRSEIVVTDEGDYDNVI